MSDRKIYCCKCNRYVGVIRDASLMVGLQYICSNCTDPVHDEKSSIFSAEDTMEAFNALFGGDIFKKR